MTLAIMNRNQIWKVVGVVLLGCGLQLFCGSQLYAQQADLGAADRDALTHDDDQGDDLHIRIEPTGTIEIYNDFINAYFSVGDIVIRSPGSPHCVARITNGLLPFSSAGQITVGGSFFGQPGGPPAPITIDNTFFNQYIYSLVPRLSSSLWGAASR